MSTRSLYQVPILRAGADTFEVVHFYEDTDALAAKRIRLARANLSHSVVEWGDPIRVERLTPAEAQANGGEFRGVAFTRVDRPYCGCATPGSTEEL